MLVLTQRILSRYMPKISVIMSVGQVPVNWLRQSIDSVLTQTFADLEFIIINDTPLDKDVAFVLKEYAQNDCRVVLIQNEEKLGISKSVNKGLEIAKGKYIARIDADDICMKQRLEKQYAYMEEHDDIVLLGTDIRFIGNWYRIWLGDNIRYDDRDIRAMMLFGNCIAQSSVLLRRDVLEDHKLFYDETLLCCEDYDMWERLMGYGKLACLNEKLVCLRISDVQISKRIGDEMKIQAAVIRCRLQKKWLERSGYPSFTEDELVHHATRVLSMLKQDKSINGTPEYKAFLQYVYLHSKDQSKKLLTPFLNGDVRNISFWNILRMIKRCIY